jgi:hypothetical protein
MGEAHDRGAMNLVFEAIRVVAGLLVAPAIAATLFTGLLWVTSSDWPALDPGDFGFFWPAAFVVALAHAVALGLPAYLLLRWAGWTRWWVSLPCGFAIGCLPFVIYFFPSWTGVGSFTQEGDRIAENAATTLVGWIEFAKIAGGLGLLGMAGAIAAWLTWYGLGRLFARGDAAAQSLQR